MKLLRRRSGRRGVMPRAAMLLGALVALGFGGFAGLERLQTAVAQVPAPPQAPGPEAGAVPPKPEKVKIYFFTVPTVPAELRWGKRKLGIINPLKGPKKPFFIERPKDSGPLDVVVRAEGFLPVNTRVYTYSDNKVWLKLTPEADKHTVLGFKVALPDAGPDGGADAGVLMPPPGPPGPLQPAPPPGPTPPPGTPAPPGSPPAAAPAPMGPQPPPPPR